MRPDGSFYEEEIGSLKSLIIEHLEAAFTGASKGFLERVAEGLVPDILDFLLNNIENEEENPDLEEV